MTIAADIEPTGLAEPERTLRPAPAVEVVELTRTFAGRVALEDVSLRVEAGEIHALLGPNGAGKTTLLRVLAGVTSPSAGHVAILGTDAARAGRDLRRAVGVVPAGDRSFYLRISGLENLLFFARLYGLRRRDATGLAWELLDRVGLTEAAQRRVGEYSMGMQKRLSIARALLPSPRLLLVDEATHDLDPLGAQEIRGLVAAVAADGAAVVWATQRLDEVQGFAHRATLLRRGHARFSGSVADLVARGSSGRFVLVLRRPDGAVPTAASVARLLGPAVAVEPAPDGGENRFLIALDDPGALGAALGRLLASGVDVVSCMQERPEVEHAFLTLTGSE
jgi:ABC-type multidrug transport system ATPase subunit